MSITPSAPIPRTSIANWQIDVIGLRIYARQVTLIYGGYDANGVRVAEQRFDLTDDTTPSLADFIAACPAGPTFKRQVETFGGTLAALLGGTVS